MDIKEQILVALGLNKEETVKLEWQAKSEDGTIFVSTAEELEAGVDISVLTEDGTTILLPVGTYKTDTGVSFRVEEEGIVAEVIESETEEVVEEEELAEETVLAEEDEKEDYEEEADVADWKGMEKRIENLEIAVAKLKEEKAAELKSLQASQAKKDYNTIQDAYDTQTGAGSSYSGGESKKGDDTSYNDPFDPGGGE